jgi:hypothetical protein
MPNVLFVGQDKGGVGKSTLVRGIAEAVRDVPILEIDKSHRLLEFDTVRTKREPRQVTFFPMRADREAIDASGGLAARAEFDAVIRAIENARVPTVVDVGANTAGVLFAVLADLADDLKSLDIKLGVLVVVTAHPAAIGEAIALRTAAEAWSEAIFVVENRLDGAVPPQELTRIVGDAPLSVFEKMVMEPEAVEIIQARGLRDIPKLDRVQINARFGVAKGARIRNDLARFREGVIEAVAPAAIWLTGEQTHAG